MPILERDPWRMQYFEHAACPDDVFIPTDDPDCWMLYPRHRWIYDKLKIAESQQLSCGPHGVMPEKCSRSGSTLNTRAPGNQAQSAKNSAASHPITT